MKLYLCRNNTRQQIRTQTWLCTNIQGLLHKDSLLCVYAMPMHPFLNKCAKPANVASGIGEDDIAASLILIAFNSISLISPYRGAHLYPFGSVHPQLCSPFPLANGYVKIRAIASLGFAIHQQDVALLSRDWRSLAICLPITLDCAYLARTRLGDDFRSSFERNRIFCSLLVI